MERAKGREKTLGKERKKGNREEKEEKALGT